MVDALLVAQVLRWHDAERLDVPPLGGRGSCRPCAGWRDLPAGPATAIRWNGSSSSTAAASSAGPPAELPDPVACRVGHESRVELQVGSGTHRLEQLQTVEERPDWRPGKATRALTSSKFALDTVETAEHIRQRLDSSSPPASLSRRCLEQDGVVRPGRWLRSLRDVGLVQRQADRWALPPDGGILLPS